MAGVTVREALDAAVAAGRYLEWPSPDPARALATISPYAECEEFADAQPGQTPRVRTIVCAVVGDCHQSLGKVEAAAGWYLRARRYTQAGGGPPFFAPFYAQMVVDHRLASHYLTALECLHDHYAVWRGQPLLTRLYWHVVSLWWVRPFQWRMWLRERRLLPQLEALARDGR